MDLNPVANLIGASRLAAAHGVDTLHPIQKSHPIYIPEDSLRWWFDRETAGRIRGLIGQFPLGPGRSHYWTALFRCLRDLTTDAVGSNPTWVKKLEDPIGVGMDDILDRFNNELLLVQSRTPGPSSKSDALSAIATADARSIPLPDSSVGTVLTSPPYLTRIDYAVTFSRELAALSADRKAYMGLRKNLMGTTLSRTSPSNPEGLGQSARKLLDAVALHQSADSAGYYRKNFEQYLSDLAGSIAELDRVMRPNAHCILVVQDSFYKDLHVELAAIVVDEAVQHGWVLELHREHEVRRSLVTLNSRAMSYGKKAVFEHELHFRKDETLQ